VHVRQEAWLARVFGPFSRATWLPKPAVVKLAMADGGVEVRASIADASAARDLSPRIMEKYHRYFVQWTAELKARLD
jgi:hypothetical protein